MTTEPPIRACAAAPRTELPLEGYYGGKPTRIVIDYDDHSSTSIGNADGSVDRIVADLKPPDIQRPDPEGLVEAVAIAICPWTHDMKIHGNPAGLWTGLSAAQQSAYRNQARAAIDLIQQNPSPESVALDRIIAVITPENVCLGHTWLKRKVHEAMGDASHRKTEAVASADSPSPANTSKSSVMEGVRPQAISQEQQVVLVNGDNVAPSYPSESSVVDLIGQTINSWVFCDEGGPGKVVMNCNFHSLKNKIANAIAPFLRAIDTPSEISLPSENVPHHNSAFINAIWEEGTKDEACRYLQQTWNELCELKEQLKPVMSPVSLEKCGMALVNHHRRSCGEVAVTLAHMKSTKEFEIQLLEEMDSAKAVLDAAGVKHADAK